MLISNGRRPRPTSKKNRRLVLAGASQGVDPLLSRWPPYVQTSFIARKEVYIFIWIYLSLDIETTSVSLFHNIES